MTFKIRPRLTNLFAKKAESVVKPRIQFQGEVPEYVVNALRKDWNNLTNVAERYNKNVSIKYQTVPANYFAKINKSHCGNRVLPKENVERLYITSGGKTSALDLAQARLDIDNKGAYNDIYRAVLFTIHGKPVNQTII